MNYSNDVIKIDTPENVTFDYNVAGIGSRFLAAIIDTLLLILIQIILFGSSLLIANFFIDEIADAFWSWLTAILIFMSFIFFWGYYIFFEIIWNGQTPGKRIVGLRVIRIDGTPVHPSEVVIRNLVRVIDFLPTAYGVGVVMMFINSKSRRVGDLAAGTLVVHEHKTEDLNNFSPVRPSATLTLGTQNHLPENFPTHQVTEHELHIIEEFLSRKEDLVNRHLLAGHILASIARRVNWAAEPATLTNAESVLAEIYKTRYSQIKE